jgi:hypothetical protein
VVRFLKIVGIVVAVVVTGFICAIVAVLVFLFWPRHATASKLSAKLAEAAVDGADGAICHEPKTFRFVHPDYKTRSDFDGRYGANPDTHRVPFPKVEVRTWSKGDRGTGTARIEGKAADWNDMSLLSSAPCVADVSFDYTCGTQDNGVSARWDCVITNVQAAKTY